MLHKYLERIGYAGALTPTYDTLYALHTAHVFSIPFENLDVYNGGTISLSTDAIFDKLVTRKRGGYCFEMNGLFSAVLEKLGFKVRNLLASKLHQVLCVEIDGREYLADVGYGNEGIAAPLLLEPGTEQDRFLDTYRFIKNENSKWVLERKTGGGFVPMYEFTLETCEPLDFEIANHYTATHPASFFKTLPFITMPTPTGRITLTGRHLKISENGAITEREIFGDAEFSAYLSEHFGLEQSAI
ncbi:MAG: arylamine N-acetyltransferase [Oscillospiraceae bacterium]|jgi:N-hydroxyarylamine O-acetyltransferase|nr:arylamine N-acetyltransferase [Oscillospiraceae bacterium]